MAGKKKSKSSRSGSPKKRATKRAPHAVKRRVTYSHVGKKTRSEIREYAKFIPSLNKLKGKTRITSAQKAQLSRAKKRLRYTDNLRPVTEKQAKVLKKKGLLAGNGIRAIRLRNTSENAKVRIRKGGVIVTSNGRTWEYHPVASDVDSMIEAGEQFLERSDVVQITLWTNRGRTNEGFEDAENWAEYIVGRYQQYAQLQEFQEGIAVEIKGKGKSKVGKI